MRPEVEGVFLEALEVAPVLRRNVRAFSHMSASINTPSAWARIILINFTSFDVAKIASYTRFC